ncbi:MAG: phosphate ABC transporter permease PstA [Cryobacterium sp.]|nr:phosphate ABC transporter permease PstA [Oligoflexia bacterium]
MLGLLGLASLVAILPLLFILYYVIHRGIAGLSIRFFTQLPKPVGETGGGLGNAVLGTLILVGLGSIIGVPVGVASGVYLAEYRRSKYANVLRSAVELLAGVPSIILGIFAYALIVVPMKGFSALAGSIALAVILIPTVAKTTEEVLKLVPDHIREAGLALGLPRWKVILRIVVYGSRSGILTGVMLGVARISGESAPLLFTALNSQYWPHGLLNPISSLPVQIYTYAISPFDEWTQLAWTGSMVLVLFVLVANLSMRALIYQKGSGGKTK